MHDLLTNAVFVSAAGTLLGLAIGGGIKFLHNLVMKTENKLDDKIYDAVAAAFKDAEAK